MRGEPCRFCRNRKLRPQAGIHRNRCLATGLSCRYPHPARRCLTLCKPEKLSGRIEARRRIEAGFAKVVHSLPGGAGGYTERWEGDRLVFSATAMGQTVSGVIDVLDTVVRMEIVLPGVLGLLAGGLKRQLQKAGTLLLTKK